MKLIIEIFGRHKLRILLVYLISIVANSLWLVEPYVLGKMIDGIIIKSYYWVTIFIVINIFFVGFGYIRRVLDTKVFSGLYNELILRYITNNISTSDTSIIIARTEMSRVITDFLENSIPMYITIIYSTFGSLIAIFLINKSSAVIVGLMLIPIYFITRFFYFKYKKMTNVNNSNSELHVNKIQTKDVSIINDYFIRRRRILIMDSTLSAKNFATFDSLALLFMISTMIYYISTSKCSMGDAMSFYGYINRKSSKIYK